MIDTIKLFLFTPFYWDIKTVTNGLVLSNNDLTLTHNINHKNIDELHFVIVYFQMVFIHFKLN